VIFVVLDFLAISNGGQAETGVLGSRNCFGLDILAQACRGLKVLDMQVCDLKVLWVLDLIQFDGICS
jgi:hypothetical protein